uniref:Small ribosomal subunit protein uS17c n=1 Tax=Alsidium seaforthii TaxID=2007182 RepID=A0A1Z1MDI9_9FLOR|nr:ribosomal protein S17 [Bryothamnion seaforthii]ARW63989.1 ribosomal protein S17 [Bryothamnion seaforthii]
MLMKEIYGIVISNRMNKTAIVSVKKPITHKKYKKIIKQTNKYYVHDPLNECEIGNKVKIRETRPLSKNKRWKLIELIKL